MPVSLDDMNFATGIAILIAIIAIVISPLALIIAGIIYGIQERKYGIQERKKRIKKEFIMTPEMESEVNDLLDEGIYESKEEAEWFVKQEEQGNQEVTTSLKGGEYNNFWGWFRIIITIAVSAFTTLYIIFYIITLFL